MMKKGLLVIAILLATQAAQAQGFFQDIGEAPRDAQTMALLTKAATAAPATYKSKDGHEWDNSITGIRGGNGSKRPLGQYLVQPNMEFRSEYKNEAPETMCQFAYDLHKFVASKGGDYRSMTMKPDSDYVSYEKQREFTSFWWLRHNKKLKDMGGIFKEWFINDALIDGTNLYNWSRRGLDGGADYTIWADAAVQQLMKKKP